MSAFSTPPFNLEVGTLITGQAEAHNDVGYNTPSVENIEGARFRSAPTVAISGYTKGSLTSKTAIEFTWTPLDSSPANGGLSVDYRVMWNQGEDIDSWATI
jgi:hypothetical protein